MYVCIVSLITVVFYNQRMRLAGLYANPFIFARAPFGLHGLVVTTYFGVSYPLVVFYKFVKYVCFMYACNGESICLYARAYLNVQESLCVYIQISIYVCQ